MLMLSQENDLPGFFSITLSLTYALRFVSLLLFCNLLGTPLSNSPPNLSSILFLLYHKGETHQTVQTLKLCQWKEGIEADGGGCIKDLRSAWDK